MAAFNFKELKSKYQDFANPHVQFVINNKDFSTNNKNLQISDIEVEMTSGFEASIATFCIYNCYDMKTSAFEFDNVKQYIFMGSSVVIYLGYGKTVREVFRGFISRVNFVYRQGDIPCIEVTAMDFKGIMMSGSYSKQLKATSFSDAVNEIMQKTAYTKLQSSQIITKLDIANTPDKQQGGGSSQGNKASDKTVEMVCESDYEFVVKAAKKFNFEFFAIGGTVIFRKAKCDSEILYEASAATGLRSFEVGYDFTGLVETVEVRGMDVGKSRLISSKQKIKNKISQGNKAKGFLSQSQKVYIDPTVSSKEDAGYRAEYLAEDISYRLGNLEAEFIGLPELTPGKFIKLTGLGTAASNKFYLHTVRHIFDSERGYITKVTGKAATME